MIAHTNPEPTSKTTGNKIVHQFENPEASRCDHVRILDLYFAKLSRDTFTFEKK